MHTNGLCLCSKSDGRTVGRPASVRALLDRRSWLTDRDIRILETLGHPHRSIRSETCPKSQNVTPRALAFDRAPAQGRQRQPREATPSGQSLPALPRVHPLGGITQPHWLLPTIQTLFACVREMRRVTCPCPKHREIEHLNVTETTNYRSRHSRPRPPLVGSVQARGAIGKTSSTEPKSSRRLLRTRFLCDSPGRDSVQS